MSVDVNVYLPFASKVFADEVSISSQLVKRQTYVKLDKAIHFPTYFPDVGAQQMAVPGNPGVRLSVGVCGFIWADISSTYVTTLLLA